MTTARKGGLINTFCQAAIISVLAALGLALWAALARVCISFIAFFMTPNTHCNIETMRGTIEYGTSCIAIGGRLDCKDKTYGMYLSYRCEENKTNNGGL